MAKQFTDTAAAIRYLERTFVQDLSHWPDSDKMCKKHKVAHKYWFGNNLTGDRFGFDSDKALLGWANKLAFGPGGTDFLWADGVDPKTGLG